MGEHSRVFLKIISCQRGRASGLIFFFAIILVAVIFYRFYPWKKTPLDVQTAASGGSLSAELNIEEAPPLKPLQPEGAVPGNSGATKQAYDSYREGDFEKAVGLYRAALKESPDSAEVRNSLAGALNRAALKEYNEGNLSRSKEMLLEAIGLSKEPAFFSNLSNVQIRENDLEGAVATLENFKDDAGIRKRLKVLYSTLAQRHRSGKPDEAIRLYEKGLALDPSDNNLRQILAKLKSEQDFESRMGSREGGHFLVRYEGGENAATGHLIGLLLEEAYVKIGSDLGFYPADRIEALLYTKESFRDVTKSPAWAGAIYDGRIKIPAGGIYDKTEELEKVIFHEYTHAVVHRIANGRAPVWLNEGIAQYEEGRTGSSYGAALKDAAASGKVKLRSLEGSFMRLNSNAAHLAYLLSLSATEYTIREFGFFSVRRVLENLGKGMTLDEAISEALYLSYDELEKSWLNNINR